LDHWQYQYLNTVLELLVLRRTVKTGNKNTKTDNHLWKTSPRGRYRSPACPIKEGDKELLKLEAHVVEITKLKEYVDSKEHPLIQIVRMYQHTTNSAMLQIARSLKIELQRGTIQLKDRAAQKTKKVGEERGCMGSSCVTEMKNWWIMNGRIVG